MGLFDKAKLEKLTLRAFKPSADPKARPQPSDDPEHAYTVQVNPSSYTLSHLLEYSYQRGQGLSGKEAVYSGSPPVHLDFEFLFDGTGVVPKPSTLGDIPLVGAIASALSPAEPFVVMDEIKKFNQLVYDYDGKIHRPRLLLLIWGTLIFPCVLSSVEYRFTLFKEDGTPLRAVAKCSFCESIPTAEAELQGNPTSPDLTHLRDVRDGDTLPLLTYDIYGDARLYLEVARVNKLINFRRLRPATRLSFPPLDKQVTTS
ncbi:MAG: LysM peptidoglycan-binding domain-containing protein [Acidobacteriota bacterium]